jgi:hypothetical protein
MSSKIAPDAPSHRVARTKTGSFSIELHPVGSGMVRASSLVGEFQQPANLLVAPATRMAGATISPGGNHVRNLRQG